MLCTAHCGGLGRARVLPKCSSRPADRLNRSVPGADMHKGQLEPVDGVRYRLASGPATRSETGNYCLEILA